MLASTATWHPWMPNLKNKEEVERQKTERKTEGNKARSTSKREKTTAERRKEAADLGDDLEMRRANAQTLIRAGCRVTPGTDSYWAAAPEFTRTPKPAEQDHGIGTIMAIEGLVELGMSPSQAIVAGTRNGASAARGLKDFGTIEAGKFADIVLLTADPLADIGNLRKVSAVIKEGRTIDRGRLPASRVLSVAPPVPPGTRDSEGSACGNTAGCWTAPGSRSCSWRSRPSIWARLPSGPSMRRGTTSTISRRFRSSTSCTPPSCGSPEPARSCWPVNGHA
jgi:hypothetical protein